MDPVLGDAALEQRLLGRVHHRPGAADEEGGDLGGIDQMVEDLVAFGAIEHAVEQVDILGLLGEEMMDLQPVHETVLEPRQRLEEDHRLAVAIAVEEGEAAVRLGQQRGLQQRHDRRDPRAAGEADIMIGGAGGRNPR